MALVRGGDMRFNNSVAVVTGGASGIGAAVSAALLAEGATVIVADLVEPSTLTLDRAENRLRYIHHDITSEKSWAAIFEQICAASCEFQLLFNCAGIMKVADVAATDSELFARLMTVNAMGTFLGCKHAIATLAKSGRSGAIVNIASTSAVKPAAWVTAYSASKAAVVNLTRSVALHCTDQGLPIRCNVVLPGVVLTPMVKAMVDAAPDPAAALESLAAQHPMKRLVTPKEVAAAALFLASPEASGITGASLAVDAGMTAA